MYNLRMSIHLPLFPLNLVLFPGQVLPLHIFEPRYRQMLKDCLESNQTFGVVLIRSGEEVGSSAEPHLVGTTAKIVQHETLPDGRSNIVCLGDARFKVLNLHTDRPYLSGTIDLWPWQSIGATPDRSSLEHSRKLLDRYLQLLSKSINSPLQIDLPSDASQIAQLAAAVLQIDPNEKQELLATDSIDELLKRVEALLRREVRGLQLLQAAERLRPRDENFSYWQN